MKRKYFLLGLVLLFFGQLSAQMMTVTGKVINGSTAEPLAGATVGVKGGATKALTDAAGRFSLSNVNSGTVLVIDYVGMVSREVKVTSSTITIELFQSASTLSDVVVVGYGTQKITKVSGAISTVKGADIEKLRPV